MSIRKMRVPTEDDWGDYQLDLDQKRAHQMFAGHTNEEMQSQFRNNPIERTSDLRWMPEKPFRYYMLGFRDFIMAGNFNRLDASDAASCFLGLVVEKLENQPRYICPIMPDLLPAIEHVARNQPAFGADEKIYGSFLEKLARVQELSSTNCSRYKKLLRRH